MTLFFNAAGPMIKYERDAFGETLRVEDLNPQKEIAFRITPMELLKFGFKCIWAAVRP
ncbi:hypothetical protein [Tardiphaga sp.]|uniref:hypothetical protein n=1 Tax=Tardiphaga sp. TaxID=1926292 RepID=UPI00352A7CD9